MKILALEFSSARRSAVVAELVPSGELRIAGSGTAENAREVTGLQLIDRALEGARATPREIDVIAVGLGPGSYVGVRSAIALAQGWQLANQTRLLGISSVEVLALGAARKGISGELTLIIDAQRQEVYAARYDMSSMEPRVTESLRIVPRTEVQGARIAGPEASRLVPGATDLYPEAADLAQLAVCRTDDKRGEELEPIYLRESSFVKAPPARFVG